MAIKLALEATVFTLVALFAILWFISRFKQKNTCPVCGDACQDKFCCEACELLFYNEEEFSREEEIDMEEEDEELYRDEMKMKSGVL